jgi:crotonobetaine/carnitine-CoA ligase
VEKAIADLGYVSDVCVYGIPAESGAPGESDIVAAVVPIPGTKLDVAIIAKELSKTLGKGYIPQYLQIVDEIPKTASEKNLDRILRDEFRLDASNVFAF